MENLRPSTSTALPSGIWTPPRFLWAHQPAHLLLSGDLGMHHQVFGDAGNQHDWLWPQRTEVDGLAAATLPTPAATSFRYARVPETSGVKMDDAISPAGLSLMFHVADLLDDETTPSDVRHTAEVTSVGVLVFATADIDAAVVADDRLVADVWYATSTSRALRGPSASAWASVPMVLIDNPGTPLPGSTILAAQLPLPPAGAGLTYDVEIREIHERGGVGYYRGASAGPVDAISLPPAAMCALPALNEPWPSP